MTIAASSPKLKGGPRGTALLVQLMVSLPLQPDQPSTPEAIRRLLNKAFAR